LAIVLGIFSAQIAGLVATGMKGDRPGGWRYVVLVSGVVAVLQLVVGQTRIPGGLMEARETERKLRDSDESDEEQSVEHRVSRLEESEGKHPRRMRDVC
jgi:SP family facilitated glucose transporter-like MFS transporter 3